MAPKIFKFNFNNNIIKQNNYLKYNVGIFNQVGPMHEIFLNKWTKEHVKLLLTNKKSVFVDSKYDTFIQNKFYDSTDYQEMIDREAFLWRHPALFSCFFKNKNELMLGFSLLTRKDNVLHDYLTKTSIGVFKVKGLDQYIRECIILCKIFKSIFGR